MSERALTQHMTITATVLVRRSWRVRAGLWFLRLGAWLAGMGYCETDHADHD